jgi:MYXO-CTERM domain-containing protein
MSNSSIIRQTSFALVICASAITFADSTLTIQVTPSLAPNAYGSPSWAGYRVNALYALENGLSNIGSGPTGYSAVTSPIDPRAGIVTGFNSWLGNADPVSTYGPDYANEYGNRMHFGLHIIGNGVRFSIDNLAFEGESFGDGNGLGWGWGPGNDPLDVYSASRVGIDYGADGLKGTLDDIIYDNGESASNLVDEFVYVGAGNSYPVYTSDLGTTNQDKIDLMAASTPWTRFVGTYTLNVDGRQFAASGEFSTVPGPAAALPFLLGLLAARRRRKA